MELILIKDSGNFMRPRRAVKLSRRFFISFFSVIINHQTKQSTLPCRLVTGGLSSLNLYFLFIMTVLEIGANTRTMSLGVTP